MYHGAAQAAIFVVENDELARCYCLLAHGEANLHPVVIQSRYHTVLVGLPIANLGTAAQTIFETDWCSTDPASIGGDEPVTEQHFVFTLRNDKGIVFEVLADDIPGFPTASVTSTDAETLSLT